MFKKLLISIVILSLILVGSLYAYYQHSINKQFTLQSTLLIESGDTLQTVLNKLKQEQAINETYSARLYARLNKKGNVLQTGEYRFKKQLNIATLLSNLAAGKGRQGIKVTILEGWTFKQMRARLAKEKKLKQLTSDWSAEQIMTELGHPDLHPEGNFYPDTYYYKAGDSDIMILKKAFAIMQEKLDLAWSKRSESTLLKNKYEALILASIIERETQVASERTTIAGVFHNRIRKGWRLQTDPTVIYGIGDDYDGDITKKHLRTDTPYNTYTRDGLPPTPISLPRFESILAAVNPEKTSAYFFVATGTGGHKFSRTYEEHKRAVSEYLKTIKAK